MLTVARVRLMVWSIGDRGGTLQPASRGHEGRPPEGGTLELRLESQKAMGRPARTGWRVF